MNQGSHILTLRNGFHLFTRIMGTGSIKLLCVHGGPGSNHEEFENFAQGLAKLPVQVAMYDQLGSFYSDQPDFDQPENKKFLNIEYFLSELEEVRQQLGWDNFYLLGHSWGGLLAQEVVMTGYLKTWDNRSQTSKITVPTLLTFGDHDTMPLAVAARMHQQLPHSRFVLTPDGGHCHSVDNPTAFFQNLGDFLSDVDNSRKEFQSC